MNINHHPDIATLITCSAGSQPESISAVVASHLSVCPECYRKVSQLSIIGVSLFERLEPSPLMSALPCGHEDAETEPEKERGSWQKNPSESLHDHEVPGPLRFILGQSLDQLEWQAFSDGIDHVQVSMSPGAAGDLRLVRIAPGREIRWKSGLHDKLIMALRGSYHNDNKTLSPGDCEDLGDVAELSVTANSRKGCIVLIASERYAVDLEVPA